MGWFTLTRDLARERLKEIRTLQGWKVAYKASGLVDDGSDATRRRRLSRAINTKTTGAKKLDPRQRQKINRTYRTREKKGVFREERVKRTVKAINKANNESTKRARKVFGTRGISPDAKKLTRRVRQYSPLSEEDITRLQEAFARADRDGGVSVRAEYARHMSKVQLINLQPSTRNQFKRRQTKANMGEWRDEIPKENRAQTTFEDWMKSKGRKS